MYVCLKIYIRRAFNKVTNASRPQTNKNVFDARLKRSLDKSTKQKSRKAVPNPRSSNSENPIAESTVGTWDDKRRSDRRLKCAPAGVSDELTVVSKVRWQLTEQQLMDHLTCIYHIYK